MERGLEHSYQRKEQRRCATAKDIHYGLLDEELKPNEGEVPQFYITDSHDGIINAEDFDMVQAEFARRKSLGRSYSCKSCFSAKLVCGDCSCFFGSKVWHSTDKYRRVIWRCNIKFNKARNVRCRI